MHGCLAPSEIPGLPDTEARAFGRVAERLIEDDYRRQYAVPPFDLFLDDYNTLEFRGFLMGRNPHFTAAQVEEYKRRLEQHGYKKHRPDILAHTPAVREFYEIKPDSRTGWYAGTHKVGVLGATFRAFRLPYRAGTRFAPREHLLAWLGNRLKVRLRPRLAGPGLVVYRVCLETDGVLDLVTIAAVLGYAIRRLNERSAGDPAGPLDLAPGLRGMELSDLAKVIGLATAARVGVAVARVGWRHFWRAVVARFAVRGTAAVALASADGPLPVGDLVAAGLAFWTVIDIIRYGPELWRDAERIARSGT